MKPAISVILCTYNGGSILKECVKSIFSQKERNIELLCIDGGSTDGSLDYLKQESKSNRRIQVINNPKRLPEGEGNGKWLGFRKAKGEIICYIDQDNVLQSKEVLSAANAILKSRHELAGVLAGLKTDKSDDPVVRYVSLVGTDSFMAYRSTDFRHNINPGKMKKEKQYTYEEFALKSSPMTITGGNCFFYRARDLQAFGGYTQDVFMIQHLIRSGKNKIAILPKATKHYAESSLTRLALKKFKWGKNYFQSKTRAQFNYMPQNSMELVELAWNSIRAITIILNFYYSIKLWNKSRDPVSWLFPFHAFLNTIAYALVFFRSKFA